MHNNSKTIAIINLDKKVNIQQAVLEFLANLSPETSNYLKPLHDKKFKNNFQSL